MTKIERGDVVLVSFIYSDESGRKHRPAVVVSSSAYNRVRQEVVVAAITSNIRRQLLGDWTIAHWKVAGLLFPSTCTGIYRTVKRGMVERKLGVMAASDLWMLDQEIRRSLGV